MDRNEVAGTFGAGFGSALAMVVSYAANHSIFWAIVDGLFGWFYILFHLIFG